MFLRSSSTLELLNKNHIQNTQKRIKDTASDTNLFYKIIHKTIPELTNEEIEKYRKDILSTQDFNKRFKIETNRHLLQIIDLIQNYKDIYILNKMRCCFLKIINPEYYFIAGDNNVFILYEDESKESDLSRKDITILFPISIKRVLLLYRDEPNILKLSDYNKFCNINNIIIKNNSRVFLCQDPCDCLKNILKNNGYKV
ncbi:DUF4238 domain-containing protein [Candidatus Margulisiibacteriota bacterium]